MPTNFKKSESIDTRTVSCPHCRQETVFSKSNPYRPFCSERCRLIDLGAWASESFRIPATEDQSVQDLEDQEQPAAEKE